MADDLTAALAEIRSRIARRDALMEQAATASRVPVTAISENLDQLAADVPKLLAAVEAALHLADSLALDPPPLTGASLLYQSGYQDAERQISRVLREDISRALLGEDGA